MDSNSFGNTNKPKYLELPNLTNITNRVSDNIPRSVDESDDETHNDNQNNSSTQNTENNSSEKHKPSKKRKKRRLRKILKLAKDDDASAFFKCGLIAIIIGMLIGIILGRGPLSKSKFRFEQILFLMAGGMAFLYFFVI